jgi:hypothetical protein
LLLSELTASAERVALVGLAKNTGKTVALAALLRELATLGRTVGVTSVGRDGEEHDVIDFRIEKPAVELGGGSLVASTDSLLRASGVPMRTLARTGLRTPLGEVLIAQLTGPGRVEVAGPSGASDVREVADAMLGFGAEQILVDGAIDRRAASSPDVTDALVMSTGAILSEDIGEVVQRTRDAVELVRLPALSRETAEGACAAELAAGLDAEARHGGAFLIGAGGESHALPPRFVLSADAQAVADLLAEQKEARCLLVCGALPEAFMGHLAAASRRRGRTLTAIVSNSTKVFLSERGIDFYRHHGITIETLHPIRLRALTINPQAPQSHQFDSGELRNKLAAAIDGLPIFDVMQPEYVGEQRRARGEVWAPNEGSSAASG